MWRVTIRWDTALRGLPIKIEKISENIYIKNIVIVIGAPAAVDTYVRYCTTTLQVENFLLQLFNELMLEVLPTVLVFSF